MHMKTMKTSVFCVAMVVVQLAYGGSNILVKVALDKGMNQIVFVVYRHLIAMLVLGPFAYVLERKQRPSLSWLMMIKIFVLATLGTTIHLNVYYAGLEYTSPTVASALSNVIPGLTFLMAVSLRMECRLNSTQTQRIKSVTETFSSYHLLLRMEKVKIGSVKGRAKILGTLLCIGGALIFTFWKGGYLFKSFFKKPLIDIDGTRGFGVARRHGKDDWIKGSALILTSHIAWSAWLILQAVVCEVYPARLSLNTLICFFASLQSSVLALVLERNPASWRLGWNVQLLTIIYCGVVISALVYYLQTWCISEKGPVFAAMFSPLLLVFVGVFSAIAFAERLHLGSFLGAFLIIVGLYCVLWGKRTKDLHN